MKRSLRDNETFMKGGFIIGNLLIFIAGGGILGLGSWMIVTQSDIFPLLGSRLYIFFAVLYVVTSSFMVLVSFYGIVSLVKWSWCLHSYWKVLLAAAVCVVGIGLLSLTFSYDMETSFRLKMYSTRHSYGQNEIITKAWDDTQKNLMCCGIMLPEDWTKDCSGCVGKLPPSCCEGDTDYCYLSKAYRTGCHGKLHVKALLYVVGGVAFFSFFVMLITMWFALSYLRIQRYERI